MDPSLVLAVDGLRAVAHTASEVIVANAGDDGDRAALAVASDVEIACLTVLGQNKPEPKEAAAPAKRERSLLGSLPFILSGGLLGAVASDAVAAGSAAEGRTPTPEERAAAAALEEALRAAQLAPITDLIVVYGAEGMPPGFSKLSHSVTGAYPADLNAASGAKQTWLAAARFPNAPPITGLAVVVLEVGEFIPPAFQPVRHLATGRPANLRLGAATPSEAYLCFTRAPGAPIIDVGLCFPFGASKPPALRDFLPGGGDGPGASLRSC